MISKILIILLMYMPFIVCSNLYIHRSVQYRGVETWPSVEAVVTSRGGGVSSAPMPGRYGGGSSFTSAEFVEFRYKVNGKVYLGTKASPDGGGAPYSNAPFRAHYKPSSPDVAVLFPFPFRGNDLLLMAVFTGILTLGHFYFTISAFFSNRKKRKPLSKRG